MTDNRTTELRISEPLRGFIRHQSNRAYIDGGQSRWLTEIADKIDAKHEQAIAATMGSEFVECGICKFYHADIQLCEYGIPPCSKFERNELNARAERTCECVAEYAKSPFDGKTIVLHRCSSCHELMRPHMLYCPNCGARRVDV